jgi:hypothetical protein
MDDTLGNPFAIEMGHLFEQQEVFKDNRAARTNRERILVIAHRASGVCGHFLSVFWHGFLPLPAE